MKMFSRIVCFVLTLCLLTMATAFADGYQSGVYTATGNGLGGDVQVQVTFADDCIQDVQVLSHNETEGIGTNAIATLPGSITASQSLAVDTVAGATVTSNAIIEAVKDCVQQAGGDVAALMQPIEAADVEKVEMDTDLVIVGGGAAGLGAAYEAWNKGIKRVILVEKATGLGGLAYISGGIIQAIGTEEIVKRGLTDDSAEAWYEYWYNFCEGHVNEPLLKKMIDMSGSTIDAMVKMGVEFADTLTYQGEASVPRALVAANGVGGKGLMQPIIDWLQANTGVNIMLSTEATDILMEDGAAVGVKAKDLNTKADITIRAAAVIMADGGANHDMIKATGADYIYRSQEPDGGIFGESGLYINAKGQRFTNESGFYARIFQDLYDSNEGNTDAYMILSQDMVDNNAKLFYQADGSAQTWATLLENGKTEGFTYNGVDGGKTYVANSVEEAIEMVGLPLEETLATIDRYNEICAAGIDSDFGKNAADLMPIGTEAPFYVRKLPLNSYNGGDQVGCPNVDDGCQVLRADGTVMDGLYAAGYTINAHFQYRMYVGSGSYIQYCTTTGRIAADTVAAALAR